MNDIHNKAKQGIKLLMGRQVVLQVLMFGGGIVLARVLGPAQFGLYAIASFLVSVFAQFGDFGLAPSLIQRKEELTELDLRVAFTLQQIVTSCIVALLVVLAPWLSHFYPKAPPETVWLVRALAVNLYLTSWRTMSALQLERHLKYDRIAVVEVIESLTYQLSAVALALTGHGVWSYVFAILASGTIGTVLLYLASPWRVRFALNKNVVANILRLGLPFQLQSIVSAAGGWVTPILVGNMVGPQAVGYLTWASSNGKKPLVLVDNVMRVAFPHFSRIQDDVDEVIRTISNYLTWLLIPSGLWFAAIFVCSPVIVPIIYGNKWLPAVPSMTIYAASLGMDAIGWVVVVSLFGLGKTKLATRYTLVRNLLAVGIGVVLVMAYGFIGVPIAFLLAALCTVPWVVNGIGRGRLKQIMFPQFWILLPTAASIILGEIDIKIHSPRIISAITSLCTVVVSFVVCTWFAGPRSIKDRIRKKLWGYLPLEVAVKVN